MERIIKHWYLFCYPSDELGHEIRNDITFEDMSLALDMECDVYEVLNVHDSLVRERVFQELARIMNVDYNYIYDKWLRA